MTNPVMQALKGAVVQGNKFTLTQQANPAKVLLAVTGGVSSVSLQLAFESVGDDPVSSFKWDSNSYTAKLLESAVEGMPDEAEPKFVVNTSLWDGGGLVLSGSWETKKGRAKEGKKHDRTFMIDAGVCATAT